MNDLIYFSDMVCSVAGITSDANVLTNELRLIGQRYLFQYGDSIPCEQLVSSLCDVKQIYTQYGGKKEDKILLPDLLLMKYFVPLHFFIKNLCNCLEELHASFSKFFF